MPGTHRKGFLRPRRSERGPARKEAAMPPAGKRVMSMPTSVKERLRESKAWVGQKVITEPKASAAPDGAAASTQRNLWSRNTLMGDLL